MINVPNEIESIINVANELASTSITTGSTNEVITAAFVLKRLEFLPYGYNVVEAWERLGDKQSLIKEIREKYSDLLVPW